MTAKPKRKLSIIITVVAIIAALLVGSVAGYFLAPTATSSNSSKLSGEIKIGAALELTGDLATYGQKAKAALQLAETQINEALNDANAGYTIKVIFEDTQTKPDVALTVTQDLASQGAQVILGYYPTGELTNVLNYAQSNHIVLISPASTGTNLAINKPYIFRFVPSDDNQGPAAAQALRSLGIDYIVPIYENNAYGSGLVNATTNRFVQLGGHYDTNGISYDPDATKEYSTQASLLNTEVQNAISTYGASHVAVYAIGYEELASIITSSNQYPALSQVLWFGGDGNTLSSAITSDTTVATFATEVHLQGTVYLPSASSLQTEVGNYVQAQTGYQPDNYVYNIYDSLWAVAKTIGFTQQYSGAAINSALPTIANYTYGASGWNGLNSNGDRLADQYQIWQVYKSNDNTYAWKQSGLYILADDKVTWSP